MCYKFKQSYWLEIISRKERRCKTTDILEFYDEFIKDKYKNHLVIMDNAVIHKSKIIRETIENSKNELLYSVPYHPETNAIEEYFSQLKHYIKKEGPNTYEDIYNTIQEILANNKNTFNKLLET